MYIFLHFHQNIIKSNQIFDARNQIKRDNLLGQGSLEPHESIENSRNVGSWVEKSHARSLQFHSCLLGISRSLVPHRSVVLCSPLRLSISVFNWGSFTSSQSFARSQTWVSSTTLDQRVHIWGTVCTPYSKGQELRMEPPES